MAKKPLKGTSYLGSVPTKGDRRSKVFTPEEWIKANKWVKVRSSNVAEILYDFRNKQLEVRFRNGTRYVYKQVPSRTATDMFHATSMGRFVWRRLRFAYPFDGPLAW